MLRHAALFAAVAVAAGVGLLLRPPLLLAAGSTFEWAYDGSSIITLDYTGLSATHDLLFAECGSSTSVAITDLPDGSVTLDISGDEGPPPDGSGSYCDVAYGDGGSGCVPPASTATCDTTGNIDGSSSPAFLAGTSYPDTTTTTVTAGTETVSLSSDDSHRLDLMWWGSWAMVGLACVAIVAPMWHRAFALDRKLGPDN